MSTEVADRQQGAPSGMSRMRREYLEPKMFDWSVAADLLPRLEADKEEDKEEDEGNGKDDEDDDDENDDGYSE